MKVCITIILCLLTMTVSAQQINTDQVDEWLGNENEYWVAMFLRAYELYEQECYDDSTLYMYSGGPSITIPEYTDSLGNKVIDARGPFTGHPIHIETKEWIHGEPTLKGFIEFLRRRIDK